MKTTGFGGRVFLTDEEHATYMRRMPVRYLKQALSDTCFVCGNPATKQKPFERSHRIPFGKGVKVYRLTPDWLDSDHNIVTAHRGECNRLAEMSDIQIRKILSGL
jgi:hypothetical protein